MAKLAEQWRNYILPLRDINPPVKEYLATDVILTEFDLIRGPDGEYYQKEHVLYLPVGKQIKGRSLREGQIRLAVVKEGEEDISNLLVVKSFTIEGAYREVKVSSFYDPNRGEDEAELKQLVPIDRVKVRTNRAPVYVAEYSLMEINGSFYVVEIYRREVRSGGTKVGLPLIRKVRTPIRNRSHSNGLSLRKRIERRMRVVEEP